MVTAQRAEGLRNRSATLKLNVFSFGGGEQFAMQIDLRMARFGHVVVKSRREQIVGALRSPRRFRNSCRLLAEDQKALREEQALREERE